MTEQRFTVFRDEHNKGKGIYDHATQRKIHRWGPIARLLNSLNNRYIRGITELKEGNKQLKEKNERLKQQIKDLRIDVLDSICEADEIKCNCNPCVVKDYVKKTIECARELQENDGK